MRTTTTETIPCRVCGDPTIMHGTKLCDPCWNMRQGLSRVRELLVRGSLQTIHNVHRWVGEALAGSELS